MSLIVLGSVALDTIETERGSAVECLGGSASHAALAASYFHRPKLIGVVGDDFPSEHWAFLAERADLSELQTLEGHTFRWHGVHSLTSGETTTKATLLNTYESFKPDLSDESADADYVFLGNIDPDLQIHVLEQLTSPKMVACDTMSLWIELKKERLKEVMGRVDLFLINDQESRELTGAQSVDEAAEQMLEWGAARVVIKCGGDGARLYTGGNRKEAPAVDDVEVMDPTGAGDNFGGALVGYLAKEGAGPDEADRLGEAMRYGASVASFAIETFGTQVHKYLTLDHIHRRLFQTARVG